MLKSKLEGIEYSISLLTKEALRLKSLISKSIKSKPSITTSKSLDKNIDNKNLRLLKSGISDKKMPNKICEKIGPNLPLDVLGRHGEIAYQNYLHEILDKSRCKIKWMNQGYESKKPYDFELTLGDHVYFIDVKATRGKFESEFYLSEREIEFAKKNRSNYFVARLSQFDNLGRYKADSFNVTLLTLSQALELIKLNKQK